MNNPTAYFENSFNNSLDIRLLELSDGTLHTEDGFSFRIHKIALIQCSRYFLVLFCGMGKGKKDYLIPGITGEVLSNILSFVYTKQIDVTETNICDIIVASDYLLIDNLISHVKTPLKEILSVDNCLDIHLSLLQVSRKDIVWESYRYVQFHFQTLLFGMDNTFCHLPLQLFKELLNDRNLRIRNETMIWKAIVKWIKEDPSNRLRAVSDLLMYLRINDVEENLAKTIMAHPIVANNMHCKIINFERQTSYKHSLKLHQCHVWNDQECFPFYISRKPLRLNFIAYCSPWNEYEDRQLYVTYDENVDLWRKVMENPIPSSYLVSIHDCIYFLCCSKRNGMILRNRRYNIIEERYIRFEGPKIHRIGYAVVTLGGFLYILGGHFFVPGGSQAIYDVEIYDPEENSWHDTTPLLPITKDISAVTLNNHIYVVGKNTASTEMSAQMYSSSTGVWIEISKPSFNDCLSFSITAYNEKIYIVGKSSVNDAIKAEVFGPFHNVWRSMQTLPHTYLDPRALVINDRLIVSEDPNEYVQPQKLNPPVQWNDKQDIWETIAECSPLFNIHHYFFTVQEGDHINVIDKQNKMSTAVFEKCPLS